VGGIVSELHGEDRRVQRTKGRLRVAIASLIHEKAYGAIAVKEILARADVGRSAFYTHFRDKDDLLVSALREALRSAAHTSARREQSIDDVLAFSLPFFEQMAQVRRLDRHMTSTERFAPVHACLRDVLTEHIAATLPRDPSGENADPSAVPRALLAAHIADAFLRVLAWWVQSDTPRSPREVDMAFRNLTRPVLAARFTR